MRALSDRLKGVAGDGRYEHFKTTQRYDAPYHRRQHGFAHGRRVLHVDHAEPESHNVA